MAAGMIGIVLHLVTWRFEEDLSKEKALKTMLANLKFRCAVFGR